MNLTIQIIFIAFSLVTAIQLFYYLFFFSRLANYKSPGVDTDKEVQPPITIIICAHNEEANLNNNLPLILEQAYHIGGLPQFEVLVVNDNSTDSSEYLLAELQKENSHLKVLNLTQESQYMKGKKFPLSMGIKEASHQHLLLTDADCMPTSSFWLAGMAQQFSDEKSIVLSYSPYFNEPSSLNRKIRFETFYSGMQYLSYALAGIPYMGVGRNLAYEKKLFAESKGFASHHHLVSGDDDLFINEVANKKNTAVLIDKNCFTYSRAKDSEAKWQAQKERHLSTGRQYKLKHKLLLGLFAVSHLLFYLLFLVNVILFKWIWIALAIFLIRMFVVWLIQSQCMKKLYESDLIKSIFFFDVWILVYYMKNLPNIFSKKNPVAWK